MKKLLKSTYSLNKKIDQLFNGDHVELDESGHILISPCNNCLNFINLQNGVILNQIKCTELNLGDREETIITFAYKNKHLIVAYNSGLLRHWLIKIEQDENQFKVDHILLRSWKSLHIHSVARIKFDSTELYIATGGSDGIVKLWNIKKYYCTHNFKEARGVISTITFASTFTQEIYYLFGSDDDYVIHIWNLINSKHIARLEGHSSKITEILITQDQRNFISASRDKLLILWNAITFEKERIMAVYESIESAVILSAKKLSIIDQTKCTSKNVILVAGESGLLKIWDYHTGNMLFTQNKSLLAIEKNKTNNNNNNENNIELQYTQINQLIYNLNLDSLVAISYDKDIIFHDISNLSPIRQLVGSNDEVLDLKFIGNDPQKNIAVATNSPKIKIFNIETLNCYLLVGHSDIVLALAVFDHDPFLMASSSKDNTVRVWHFSLDCLSAVCLFQGTGHTHSITSIFTSWKSTDSNFFITGSEDSTIKYWKLPNIDSFDINHSISNIKSKFTQSCHEKIINSVDVAPNNQLVATGSQDKTAKLWTLPNFKQLTVFRGHRKGKFLILKIIFNFFLFSGIWFVKFSPVDEILATCSADTTIKLWSIANENCLKTFQGHMSSVLKLHFIDDGMQFMTSSSDGNVKIWNICSNECTTTFDAHEGKIWALALSNDEETLGQ